VAYRMLLALGALGAKAAVNMVDVTHNDIRAEWVHNTPAWVHRKGAAPAYAGDATLSLGSRGTPSWLLQGTGSEHGLRSVAHGAGRRMQRSEARAKLKHKYLRTELSRVGGGRVICDDTALLYEEHPDAYKNIEAVVAALEAHGLATRTAKLSPVMTVKL
jgi:release factor H-coupled RctB family protein